VAAQILQAAFGEKKGSKLQRQIIFLVSILSAEKYFIHKSIALSKLASNWKLTFIIHLSKKYILFFPFCNRLYPFLKLQLKNVHATV